MAEENRGMVEQLGKLEYVRHGSVGLGSWGSYTQFSESLQDG